ncbi:hypothetical protein FNV43_RR01256 [Rhamnella rubrinervis]|uniref:Ribosomal RNA small subunit methyltransferase NEP1 n=1 Tax=Rhamnella rubrinervis TaxID=2594499 RepID=A0A8K0HPA2_9ROSA|nr:hypothetical protein FNV43_RR01256 [Rhamnella rubrinervis]
MSPKYPKSGLKRKRIEKKHSKATAEKDLKNGEDGDVTQKPILPHEPNVKARAIFVLENASLTKGHVRKEWKILNSEEDAGFLLKQKKDLNDFCPSVVYEALRAIFDSKLNKAGMVGAVYVKTDEGLLIEFNPNVRIPRSCKRFYGVMLDLLQKKCIRTEDTNEVLIRVIEGPVTRHLPVNSHVVGLSYNSEKLVDLDDYFGAVGDDSDIVFVVGAMVRGKINMEYADDVISVSGYPLRAYVCAGIICEALEHKWMIF